MHRCTSGVACTYVSPPEAEHHRLCELHAHLAGWADADTVLERIRGRPIDWSAYANAFERAYGRMPRIRRLLSRMRAGEDARDEFRHLYCFLDEDGGDFDRFQAKFDLIGWSSALATPQRSLTAAIVSELDGNLDAVADDCRRIGIGHVELRMMLSRRHSDALRQAVFAHLAEGCAARSDASLQMRIAVSLTRGAAHRDTDWLGELMTGPAGAWITAVDFCHLEEAHPPKRDAVFAEWLQGFNQQYPERALALLYHVGETFRDKSLESAVRWCHEAAGLGAHRLGHCLALGLDPAGFGRHQRYERLDERLDQIAYDLAHQAGLRERGVRVDAAALRTERAALRGSDHRRMLSQRYGPDRLEQVRRRQDYVLRGLAGRGTVVECCPTSNCRIAGIDGDAHPVHRFRALGVRVVIGADDPGLLDTDLATELDRVCGDDHALRAQLTATAWDARSERLSGRRAQHPPRLPI